MALETYRRKRDFEQTSEPAGEVEHGTQQRYVVQEHHATRLHFDLRLEMEGVLKSWAVPKGPSYNPRDKRLAVMTEDHPIEYLSYEGHIPEGSYGAGDVRVWDVGTYALFEGVDPVKELARGKLKIEFHGNRLRGKFALIRMHGDENQWLLIKEHDEYEDPTWKLPKILPWGTNRSKPAGVDADRLSPPGDVDRTTIHDKARDVDGSPATPNDLGGEPIPRAIKNAMPERIEPMLATLVDSPFSDPEWLFELKWDGYRGLCFLDNGRARLVSRNDIDLGARYPALPELAGKIRARQAVIDGEIVAVDSEGRPRFQLIQTALQSTAGRTVVYYAFDLLYLDGFDLRHCPLIERKRLLKDILTPDAVLRYSDHVEGDGLALFRQARALMIEGLMAKRAQSTYEGRRSKEWLKIKILQHTDVVIGGYTEPRGGRKLVGSLLAGAYQNGKLIPVGHVSIGSNAKRIAQIYDKLQPLTTDHSPFDQKPRLNETPHWVRPEIVAEVKFGNWTEDRQLRHPILLDFRIDKDPRECHLEMPVETEEVTRSDAENHEPEAPPARGSINRAQSETQEHSILADKDGPVKATVTVDGIDVHLTNLNKVYWPADGFTKRELLHYYYRMAPILLPHLRDRPLILKRYPNGIDKDHFFQHDLPDAPEFVDIYERAERGKTVCYAVCNKTATLLYLANLGAISFDAWMSRVDLTAARPGEPELAGRPDYIVFDLDPDDVPMEGVCEVAMAVKSELDAVGLASYAKTSGASGLHVYMPVERLYSFEEMLRFANVIAAQVEAKLPKLVTTERRVKERGRQRVYLDCYQNSEGKSVAAVYSARARAGATVSAPVTWDEVERVVRIEDFTIANMPERIRKAGDLFEGVLTNCQRLSGAVERLQQRITTP